MTPLIFLDIDGVVTSCMTTPGSYINHEPSDYGPSPDCVERLKRLCDMTNAKIVISSNWRKFDDANSWTYKGKAYKNPLPSLRMLLYDYIVGTLDKIRHQPKAEALRRWFRSAGIDQTEYHYVVFDDDPREQFGTSEFKEHYIETNAFTGLTDSDCEKAKNLLFTMGE